MTKEIKTIGVVASIGILIVGTAGCRPEPASASPPALLFTPGSQPDAEHRWSQAAALRAAMFSVHFFSDHADDRWLPEELRPIPLNEAARILSAASDERAESRRRRAIAALSAAGLTAPRRDALKILDAPIDAIEAAMLVALDARGGSGREVLSGPFSVPLTIKISAVVHDLLDKLRGLSIVECERKPPVSVVDTDPKTGAWRGTFTLSVRRELEGDNVSATIDPQNWDVCGAKYWTKSYVAESTGGKYVEDVNGDVSESKSPPHPGSDWQDTLFESVVLNLAGCSGSFRTLLKIDSTPTFDAKNALEKFHFDYELQKPIRGEVCNWWVCNEANPGGIEIDRGHGEARVDKTDNNWTELEGVKIIRFRDFGATWDTWLNALVPTFLKAMGGEMYEAACCRP